MAATRQLIWEEQGHFNKDCCGRILLDGMLFIIIQVEKSFNRMNMDVGMHHANNRGNKDVPLAILSRVLAQSCVTLCLNCLGRGYA